MSQLKRTVRPDSREAAAVKLNRERHINLGFFGAQHQHATPHTHTHAQTNTRTAALQRQLFTADMLMVGPRLVRCQGAPHRPLESCDSNEDEFTKLIYTWGTEEKGVL